MNLDLFYTQLLREEVIKKIRKEWEYKWILNGYGKTFSTTNNLKSKSKFYHAIVEDIDAAIEECHGKLDLPFEMIISKDSVRRFLDLGYQKTFEEKTKNSFAVYVGYDGWDQYVESYKSNKTLQTVNVIHINTLFPVKQKRILHETLQLGLPKRRSYLKYIFGVLVVFSILFLTYYAYSYWQQNRIYTEKEKRKVVLKLIKRSHDYNPCMATFAYDFSSLPIDSAVVYFSSLRGHFDERFQVLRENKGEFTFAFYKPGIWPIQIKYGNQLIADTVINIKSDGWVCWTRYLDDYNASRLYPKSDYYTEGILFLSREKIIVPSERANYDCQFSIIQDFKLKINESIVEIRLKNSPDEYGLSCYDTGFSLISDNGFNFSIMFRRNGCQFNKDVFDLETKSFTVQKDYLFDEWSTVKVILNNGKGSVFIENRPFHFFEYPKQYFNHLAGIRFYSKGSGKLEYVKVSDEKDQLVYCDDFDTIPKSTIGGY